MKYLKLFEDITYTPEKLEYFVKEYEEIRDEAKAFVEKHATNILSISIKDVYSDLESYKILMKKIEQTKEIIEKVEEKINNLIDVYPLLPSERPEGTHDLISKLEYNIQRDLSNYQIELYELVEILDKFIYIAEHQKNNEIISRKLQ
jgi:hypothetical protein